MNKAIEFKNIKKAYGSQVILENLIFPWRRANS